MAFIETPRLPDEISFGATFGPAYQTTVTTVRSGHEQRNSNWAAARLAIDLGYGGKTQADTDALRDFFHAVQGRAHGFRVKDWTDFEAKTTDTTAKRIDAEKYQLQKTYTAGALQRIRDITKPVSGTVSVFVNGAPAAATVDTTKGIVTITATGTAITVSSISKAAQAVVVTSTPHGLIVGQGVKFDNGALGMIQIHGLAGFVISVTNTTTFVIGINTTAFTTYTSGAKIAALPKAADVVTWSGEFDVPCRFDTDAMRIEIDTRGAQGLFYNWSGVQLIELRA